MNFQNPPSLHRLTAWSPGMPEERSLDNGLSLLALPGSEEGVIQVDFVSLQGKASHPAQPALPLLVARLMEEGYLSPDRRLTTLLEQHGAQLSVSAGEDLFCVQVRMLARHADLLLPHIATFLRKPFFPAEALQRVSKTLLNELRIQEATPPYLTIKRLKEKLFPDSPYGHSLQRSEVEQLCLAECSSFLETHAWCAPYVLLSGDVKDAHLEVAAQAFSSVPCCSVRHEAGIQLPLPIHGREVLARTNVTQASIACGCHMPLPAVEDYAALFMLNGVLGGFFGSRLMQVLREQKGYTYGVHTQLSYHQRVGYWLLKTEVQKDVASAACEQISIEIGRLQQEQVPAEELDRAACYFTSRLCSYFENSFSQAAALIKARLVGLSLDHYARLAEQLSGVSAAQLQRAAQTYLRADHLSWVVLDPLAGEEGK